MSDPCSAQMGNGEPCRTHPNDTCSLCGHDRCGRHIKYRANIQLEMWGTSASVCSDCVREHPAEALQSIIRATTTLRDFATDYRNSRPRRVEPTTLHG